MEVIAHLDVWAPKYWRSADRTRFDYVGIPYARRLAESLGAKFSLSKDPVWITDRIVTSGEVPMVTEYETIDDSACVKTEDGYTGDPLKDDQTLFIKSDQGLIVISGCATGASSIPSAGARKLQKPNAFMRWSGVFI